MADYLYVVESGTIIPDTADLQTTVQDEYKAAFGADLVVTPDTPQGVLIVAETLARANALRNNAALANQINPNLAGGVFLDAIWALTGGARTPAVRSTVTAQLTGVPAAIIPAGSQAALTTGEVFESLTGVVLDDAGDGEVVFRALVAGPVAVDANTLTQIITPVLGWETIDNADAGTTGTQTQSDAAARSLRRRTLALQGTSLSEAITSALYSVEGVRSLAFRENIAATTETIDGITMVAHSVYACVEGGSDDDVAAALLATKSAGAAWNGGTSVTVTDQWSGQNYTVLFDRPAEIGVLIRVTARAGTVTSPTIRIQDAVLAYADSEDGFIVGSDVSAFEIAAAVNAAIPGLFVTLVETSYASPVSWGTGVLAIGLDEIAKTIRTSITVVLV